MKRLKRLCALTAIVGASWFTLYESSAGWEVQINTSTGELRIEKSQFTGERPRTKSGGGRAAGQG